MRDPFDAIHPVARVRLEETEDEVAEEVATALGRTGERLERAIADHAQVPADAAASRTLRYTVRGATAAVRFEDGRPFHELDLRTGRTEVVHPCGQDTYRGELQVTGPDRWVQRWEVGGPTKAYVSTTVVTRPHRTGAQA